MSNLNEIFNREDNWYTVEKDRLFIFLLEKCDHLDYIKDFLKIVPLDRLKDFYNNTNDSYYKMPLRIDESTPVYDMITRCINWFNLSSYLQRKYHPINASSSGIIRSGIEKVYNKEFYKHVIENHNEILDPEHLVITYIFDNKIVYADE